MDETTRLQVSDVAAVVAAYRPDAGAARNIGRIVAGAGHVIVVDDGSGPAWDDFFSDLAEAHEESLTVVRLSRNSGIAHALNRGVQLALQKACRAVLTFDQDSVIREGYLTAMISAADRLASAGRPFGALAAGMQSGNEVRAVGHKDRGDVLTPTREAIQSGLFIPIETFERTGLFDEGLFIDCVDTDFIARATAIGLPTYLNRASAIDHPLGVRLETPRLRVTRGGARSFAFHPAWRRYYISRNRALMLARHGVRNPVQAAVGLAGETVQLTRCIAFGPQKRQQGIAAALGVVDAVRGRRGRHEGRGAALVGAPR